MKRWKWFNKISNLNDSLDKQVRQIYRIKYFDFRNRPTEEQKRKIIKDIYEWLEEEIEVK